jgi:hypothetical protein
MFGLLRPRRRELYDTVEVYLNVEKINSRAEDEFGR